MTVADVASATAVTLPNADLGDDGRFGAHRAVAFDDTGTRVLYLRNGRAHEVVLRDLATGAENTVDAGPGLVWSVRFATESQILVLRVFPSGTWPIYVTDLAPRGCRGAVTSYFSIGSRGERPLVRLLPLSGGAAIGGEDIIAPFAGRALVRRKDGALGIRDPRGDENTMVPAACHGHVRHLDSGRGLLLVTCSKRKPSGEVPLWLYGPAGGKELGAIYASDGDNLTDTNEHVVRVRARATCSASATSVVESRESARNTRLPSAAVAYTPSHAILDREVVFDATDHYAAFEVLSGEQWHPLCVAPCRVRVASGGTFRVSGQGIRTSRRFSVPMDSAPLVVFARTGSTDVDQIGAALLVVGGVGFIAGFAIGLSDFCILCIPKESAAQTSSEHTGAVFLGLGAALMLGGVVTLVANKTRLEFRTGTAARGPSLHLARGLELGADGLRF